VLIGPVQVFQDERQRCRRTENGENLGEAAEHAVPFGLAVVDRVWCLGQQFGELRQQRQQRPQ
jgi:hypothetical protein